ncbi:MAG: serine/threonine-protein kinase [Byssovorax sp.]
MPIAAGALLAQRYRAETLLGRGGMGEVWLCRDIEQKREVAIKAVRPDFLADPGAARLFHAEIVATARLNHPGIIPVYDLIRDPSGPALLVMAYREGPSLGSFTPADLTWPFVAEVLKQLLEALAYAHARGVLHLDIKPENVILERRGSRIRATLLDFGIARIRRPGRGIERWFDRDAVIGTVEYMSPEQCSGTFERLGPWSDLFSVGALAFELCAGYRPFPGPSQPTAMVRRLTDPPPRLRSLVPGIPPEFLDFCDLLLANEPRLRPLLAADALQMLRAIEPDAAEPEPIGFGEIPIGTWSPDVETRIAPEVLNPTMTFDELSSDEPREVSRSIVDLPTRGLEDKSSAEAAFTADEETPTTGAYGLFGLRELPVMGRLDQRRDVWNAVRAVVIAHRPCVVFLEGPAGSGKSRIARDAMERASELGLCLGMQTSWSQAGSGDEGLRGLLENLLDTRGAAAPQVRARLDFWLDRIPGNHRAFSREVEIFLRPSRDAAPDAGLPLRVAVEAIARAAALRPVLLWLDDVQWSRGEAGALLTAIRARDPGLPVCVIATVRSDEIEDRIAYERMASAPSSHRVRVDPLDLEATRRLVRGLLDVDEELCDFLAARAEGNPLFVTQLLQQLVVAEAVERRDGRYRLARAFDLSTVPADIRAVWSRRIDQCGASAADLGTLALVRERVSLNVADELIRLLAAPVSTRAVPPGPPTTTPLSRVLPPITGPKRSTFEASIARALSVGLLRIEGGAYVWAHGLLRAHLISGLAAEHARDLHGIAASALAPLVDREDVQEERAMHFYRAGSVREACESMVDAGLWSFRRADAAPRRARFEAASSWASAAGIRDIEARALAELAYSNAEIGERTRAEEQIQAALAYASQPDSGPVAAWVALRHAQVARIQGLGAVGSQATAEALRRARAHRVGEVERLALLQLAVDRARAGDGEGAQLLLREAAQLCRAAGDAGAESMAVRSLAISVDPATAVGLAEQAIELARSIGALRLELAAKQVWVDALWRLGDHAKARREAGELADEAARRSLRQTVSLLELQSAAWAASERDWTDARTHRNAAAKWGADAGALVERAVLASLDVVLAVASGEESSSISSIDTFEQIRGGCADPTILEILALADEMAPPSVAARLSRISR